MGKDKSSSSSGRSPRTPATGDRVGRSRPATDARKPNVGRKSSRIVDPGSEHGVPYPGDIPNPLAGKYRGCF